MKVSTDYSDGQYFMMPARERDSHDSDEGWAWYEKGLVEITDAEWAEYDLFLTQSAKWHQRIRVLDEQAQNQRDPVDTDQKA